MCPSPSLSWLKKSLVPLADKLMQAGDTPAVIRFDAEASTTTSRASIGEQACKLASGLVRDGFRQGESAVVMAPPSEPFFSATLAILRAGGIVVPLDIQMSDEHLCHAFENSGSKRVFTTAAIAKRLRKIESLNACRVHIMDTGEDDPDCWQKLFDTDIRDAAEIAGEQTAVLFYTSGTTGRPKGVPLSHDNLVFQIGTLADSGLVREDDRMLLPLPLHHVYPVVIGMLTPLALGVPIILPHTLTGGAITRALREGKATVVLGVPRLYRAIFNGIRDKFAASGGIATGIFRLMLAAGKLGNRMGIPLGRWLFSSVHRRAGPHVRLLACGGSPLEPTLARNLEALGWPIAVGYGLTETSPLLTLRWPGGNRFDSVGKAIAGIELKIDSTVAGEADTKGGRDTSTGELLARGPGVFSGYHKMAEESAAVFTDGWFRTGDRASMDADGYVFLKGRVATMIVLENGENIDPEKVEAAYEECAEIAEIGIVADNGKLAALVVPERGLLREHSADALQKVLRQTMEKRAASMPSYQRVSRMEISEAPLERTRLGKLRRPDLAKAYRAAKAGLDSAKSKSTQPVQVAEMDSNSRALMEDARVSKLWKALCKLYPDKSLSPASHMEFDLGVDSLEWVELSLMLEEQVGVSVNESLYQKCLYVRDLMEAVAEGEASDGTAHSGGSRRPLEDPESVIPENEQKWAEPRGPVALFFGTIIYALLAAIAKLYFRIEARGLNNIPARGCYILTPNHVSFLDAPAVGFAMGYQRARRCFWAGWSGLLFRNAFWRVISRLAQVVPIKRGEGPVSSLSFGALVLKRGQPLVWFPQGQIASDGKHQPFRQGIGLLLEHHETPVIPVFIEGTGKALPLGKSIPKPVKITVHFGKALDPSKLKQSIKTRQKDLHAQLTQAVEKAVNELGESP